MSEEKTIEQLSQEYTAEIINDLNNASFEDDLDLTSYCAYAGRLASMGNNAFIAKAEEVFNTSNYFGRIDEIFNNRFQAVSFNIKEQTGEDRGIYIEIAQDFNCFVNHVSYRFNKQTLTAFNEMLETAENEPLNEEGVESLTDYLVLFPISEEDQLGVVAAPMSEQEEDTLDTLLNPDRGKSLKASWNPLEGYWSIQTRFGGVYISSLKKEANAWSFKVINDDGHEAPVLQMRLGILPVVQSDNPTVWQATYDWMRSKSAAEIESQPLCVQFAGGGKAEFHFDFANMPRSLSISDFRLKKCSLESALMAAATESDPQIKKFHWKNSDDSIRLTGWLYSDRWELTWTGGELTEIQIGEKTFLVEELDLLEISSKELDSLLESAKGENLPVSVSTKGQAKTILELVEHF